MNEDDRYRGRAFVDMKSTEGWRLLEEYLDELIETAKNSLLTCQMEKIVIYRVRVEMVKALRAFIDQEIEKGE